MPDQTLPDPVLPGNLTLIEKVKVYAIEVVLHKVGPAALGSLLSLATAFILAHQGAFEAYGVNYISSWSPDWLASHPISGKVLLIELDTTSLQAIAGAITLAVAFVTTGGHHATAALIKKPQDGGQRSTDV